MRGISKLLKQKNQLSVVLSLVCVLIANISYGQTRVSGTVYDATDGSTLPGVNILVKGSATGTSTGPHGQYSLQVSSLQDTLVFTYVGYKKQEVSIQGRANIDVRLKSKVLTGEELVVVGYGSVEESDLTGSVSSIDGEALDNSPATNFAQSLQGRAAGVQVTQSTGAPGGEASIRIRGTTSVNASSEPLYVIDGMIVNNNRSETTIGGRGPSISPLSTINPNNIKSIEVLKDASATAIYGSRGANGVILITTKSGKAGTGSVNFDSYYGFQQVRNKLDLLNATQYAKLVNEAEINAGRNPVYVNPDNLGEGTDWQEELFRVAPVANYNLSFNGGDDQTQYAISGGYFTQDGIIVGSNFNRYSFRANLNQDINDKLSVGDHFSFNRLNSNGVLTGPGNIVPGVVTNALQINPILPVYDPTQEGGYTYEHDRKDAVANPVAEAREYVSETTTNRLLGDVYAKYEFTNALAFKSSFGIDRLTTKSNTFGPNYLRRAENSNGEASVETLQALTWINENTLTYNQNFDDDELNATLGFTAQKFKNESLSAVAFDFPDGRTGWHDLSAARNPQNPTNGESEWSMMSYLARINYVLNNKYIFTFSGRVDGSSKFSKGNKYGVFPSGAIAWRASEEPFLQDVDFISNLKFRGSYGVVGNQSISPYQSLALIAPFGEGVFSNGAESVPFYGQEPVGYPNRDLKWESTAQLSLGMDLAILNDRVKLTTEVYNKKTRDLLLNTPIPYTTGFENTLLNIGNMLNRGVDIALNTVNLQGAISWNSSFNLSFNKNKITNLARDEDINLGVGGNILREGEPVGSFYGYVFDGIYQSDEEAANSPNVAGRQQPVAGDRKYKDLNSDGVVNEKDRTILGDAQPDFTWGFRNQLYYKNFSLSFFIQGSQGNDMVNMNLLDLEAVNGNQNVLQDAWVNRWTPDNPSNQYARPDANSTDNIFSSRFVEDASYVRLKDITIGYTLPASITEPLRINNVRIYAKGTNIWTLTDYSGYDPEGNAYSETSNIYGVDSGNYPQARTYTFGINVGF